MVRPEPVINSSLKCAAIVYAIESLDESIEYVVLIDADVIPHEQWLAQMLEPFGDQSVGATNGNRWFEPVDGTIGSWVRYLWNAAAVVQMYLYSIAWGGSLALRRKAIEGTKLIERWSRSLCEDTMVGPHMLRNGWKMVPIPRLMMVNRENISMRNAINWTYRQLLFAKLYHWRWWLVAGHGILLFGSSWLALATFIVGLFIADSLWIPTAIGLLALANYLFCGVGLILVLEKTVRDTVSHRENFDWSFVRSAAKLFVAGTLLFFVQPLGTLWASVTKKLVWRRVIYRIKNSFDIEIHSIDSAPGNDGRSI